MAPSFRLDRRLLTLPLLVLVAACSSGGSDGGGTTDPPTGPAPVASVDVTPTSATINVGQSTQLGASAEERDAELTELTTERDALLARLATLESAATDAASLRDQLAAALAAKIAAENAQTEAMTESERQETLLATARRQLEQEEAVSLRAQREVTVLNEQVATFADIWP